MRCRGRRGGKTRDMGLAIVSFGIGLIVALCCPKGMIIAIMAAALIIMGIAMCR